MSMLFQRRITSLQLQRAADGKRLPWADPVNYCDLQIVRFSDYHKPSLKNHVFTFNENIRSHPFADDRLQWYR
ncbi:MAG: hypothetical protein R3C56_33435 [Pirellulaceae bacterium]